jgi:hypothetical protein
MSSQNEPTGRSAVVSRRSGLVAGDLALVALFLALLYIQLAHHNLWRDELNAFAITWASPSLHELFHKLHYEGHPWLWYVLLWLISRFTESFVAMKVLQACIATGILLTIALCSPFRRWEKALILAGYFISYEYTVLSRMYGLVVLFLFLYCWRRVTRPAKPVIGAVFLGLMASSDSIGILLSLVLIFEYLYAVYFERGHGHVSTQSRRSLAVALAVYATLTGLSLWSMKTASDISRRTTGRPLASALSLHHLCGAFVRYAVQPFFPVKGPWTGYFWAPILGRSNITLYSVLTVVVLLFLYLALRRNRRLMLTVALMIVVGTLFGHLVYLGSMRHYGMTFLVFLVAVWIIRAQAPGAMLPWAAYVMLSLSAACGIWAAIASWRHPFSNAKVAADWIVANRLQNMPMVGQEDSSVAGVAEYLHRPIYRIECACEDRYMLFSSRRDNYDDRDAPERILGALHFYRNVPVLFVDAQVMSASERSLLEAEGVRIQPLAQFTGAEAFAEDFYLYRLEVRASAEAQQQPAISSHAVASEGTHHA